MSFLSPLSPTEMGLILLVPRPMDSVIRIIFFPRVYYKPPDVGLWDSAEDELSILSLVSCFSQLFSHHPPSSCLPYSSIWILANLPPEGH